MIPAIRGVAPRDEKKKGGTTHDRHIQLGVHLIIGCSVHDPLTTSHARVRGVLSSEESNAGGNYNLL